MGDDEEDDEILSLSMSSLNGNEEEKSDDEELDDRYASKDDGDIDPHVWKIVTILFMSHRI